MKKECGGFDEQTFVVLQITFIRPSGTRHNFLRRALTTMRRLSSPVVIEDNNCMRAHRIRSETRSIFDLKSGVQSVSSGVENEARSRIQILRNATIVAVNMLLIVLYSEWRKNLFLSWMDISRGWQPYIQNDARINNVFVTYIMTSSFRNATPWLNVSSINVLEKGHIPMGRLLESRPGESWPGVPAKTINMFRLVHLRV